MAHLNYTIYGLGYRSQLCIIDLTGEEVSPSLRSDKSTIMAYILPSEANKYTAFRKGTQIYYGYNLNECLEIIKQRLGLSAIQLPKKYDPYFLPTERKKLPQEV